MSRIRLDRFVEALIEATVFTQALLSRLPLAVESFSAEFECFRPRRSRPENPLESQFHIGGLLFGIFMHRCRLKIELAYPRGLDTTRYDTSGPYAKIRLNDRAFCVLARRRNGKGLRVVAAFENDKEGGCENL